VVAAAGIEGTVDVEELNAVLDRLRARHALLAVRVSFDAQDVAWYEQEGVPPLSVRTILRESDDQWLQVVEEESRTSFPLTTGPLVRFALVHGSDVSELVLCGHHAVTDGRSMVYLIRDILHHLGHPEAPVEPLPPPPLITPETVQDPPRFGLLMRGLTGLLNWAWARKDLRFGDQDMERLHEVFWERNHGMKAQAWRLSEHETTSLVKRCREEKVTVNSAIWAAFMAAQFEVQGDSEAFRRTAGLAVSTRDKLTVPAGEAFGFFASSLTVDLPYDPKAGFWDRARDYQGRIRGELAKTDIFRMLAGDLLHPTLMDSLYFRKYGLIDQALPVKMLKKLNWDGMQYGYSITNVGRMELPVEYGSFRLVSVYGPFFYSDVNEKVVGVTTVGNRLSFLMAFDENKIGTSTGKKVGDRALEYISKAVGRTCP
jgi:NRPS condensation-like uncharacterized protein